MQNMQKKNYKNKNKIRKFNEFNLTFKLIIIHL